MESEESLYLARILIEIRQISSELLPIGHSFIPFDILITAIRGNDDGKELTVKALFASLPYSDMGIRYHFNQLLKQGWITLHNGDIDSRIKRVSPSEKLIQSFELLYLRTQPFFKEA